MLHGVAVVLVQALTKHIAQSRLKSAMHSVISSQPYKLPLILTAQVSDA